MSGISYAFRVRARNKWGFGPYSKTVLIEASTKPATEFTTPVILNSGLNILISWPLPAEKVPQFLSTRLLFVHRVDLRLKVRILIVMEFLLNC